MSLKKFLMSIVSSTIIVSSMSTSVFAAENTLEKEIIKSFDDFNNDVSKLLDEKVEVIDDKVVITKLYIDKNGDKVESTLKYDKSIKRSSDEGSTSTEMSKNIDGWGKISLSAKFDWFKQGNFKYVRCSSASGSFYPLNSSITSRIQTTKTSGYVSIGKAEAKSVFYLTDKRNGKDRDGQIIITCDDNGSIS